MLTDQTSATHQVRKMTIASRRAFRKVGSSLEASGSPLSRGVDLGGFDVGKADSVGFFQ
ncbi:uncharacterized protein METZ01_LOCUS248349 [marine metagenome]|uniref:Uncharacterized protein n=1 Tax=marine metagenome TaxID=408172 RepID=A0A382I7Y4_9ZZZZ